MVSSISNQPPVAVAETSVPKKQEPARMLPFQTAGKVEGLQRNKDFYFKIDQVLSEMFYLSPTPQSPYQGLSSYLGNLYEKYQKPEVSKLRWDAYNKALAKTQEMDEKYAERVQNAIENFVRLFELMPPHLNKEIGFRYQDHLQKAVKVDEKRAHTRSNQILETLNKKYGMDVDIFL